MRREAQFYSPYDRGSIYPDPSTSEFKKNVTELVETEKGVLTDFFGFEVEVPPPPLELFDYQTWAKVIGIHSLQAHYLPRVTLSKEAELPGWKYKPNDEFWEYTSGALPGTWTLVDTTPKPDIHHEYSNDPLAPFLLALRMKNRKKFRSFDDTSRFNLTYSQVTTWVIPAFSELLQPYQPPALRLFVVSELPSEKDATPEPSYKDVTVRLPTAMEFNILGNVHYPQWGETSAHEWFEALPFETMYEGDQYVPGGPRISYLFGGGSTTETEGNGLTYFGYVDDDEGDREIGFRLVIDFSNQDSIKRLLNT